MANAPDSLLVTGPNNQQIPSGDVLVTPTAGTQGTLADLLAGGGGGGSAAGPVGTVQMSDGAGGFAASDFFDNSTPGAMAVTLTDEGVVAYGTDGGNFFLGPVSVGAGTVFQEAYGTGNYNTFGSQAARGTRDAPTAVLDADVLFTMEAGGRGVEGYSSGFTLTVTAASDFDGTPTSKFDMVNASNLGLHIAADGTVSFDSQTAAVGTVLMSDGAGGFAASDFFDNLTTPGDVTVSLEDAGGLPSVGGPGVVIGGPNGGSVLNLKPSGTAESQTALQLVGYFADDQNSAILFASAEGSPDLPAEITSGAGLGSIVWQGYDGTSGWQFAGRISIQAQSSFSVAPTSNIDIINASNLGLHIAANATLTVDHGIVAGTGTVTATAGAATLNQVAGIVTSEALVAAVTYTLTLTNSFVSASSVVMVVPIASTGIAMPITSVTAGSGSVVVVVTSAALTGTIKFMFQVCN